MSRAFADIAFTDTVRRLQQQDGSRETYSGLDRPDVERGDRLTAAEATFITARDGFYQATVSETGWPYVQFRGGSVGFLKVIDDRTLGYADFRGNRQLISAGNLAVNDKVALFLMDYANRSRLKVWARAEMLPVSGNADLAALLGDPTYRALPERLVILTVEAFDWNCPQHIPQRFTRDQLAPDLDAMRRRIRDLEQENSELKEFLMPASG
ncbi:pyridoxamine 5-phosphate oxidase [Rhodobacterales bacterium]|nr:pyridoxamine 5-phosphate oxidase [Rhodobacterales bacterium]